MCELNTTGKSGNYGIPTPEQIRDYPRPTPTPDEPRKQLLALHIAGEISMLRQVGKFSGQGGEIPMTSLKREALDQELNLINDVLSLSNWTGRFEGRTLEKSDKPSEKWIGNLTEAPQIVLVVQPIQRIGVGRKLTE